MAALGETGTVLVEKTRVESETGPVPVEEPKPDAMLDVLFVDGAEKVEAPLGLTGTVPLPEAPVKRETGLVPVA